MTRLVTLIDGRQVPSDSEAWRHECEARAVMNMPTLEARRGYLAKVGAIRGAQARKLLEATIAEIWATRKKTGT